LVIVIVLWRTMFGWQATLRPLVENVFLLALTSASARCVTVHYIRFRTCKLTETVRPNWSVVATLKTPGTRIVELVVIVSGNSMLGVSVNLFGHFIPVELFIKRIFSLKSVDIISKGSEVIPLWSGIGPTLNLCVVESLRDVKILLRSTGVLFVKIFRLIRRQIFIEIEIIVINVSCIFYNTQII